MRRTRTGRRSMRAGPTRGCRPGRACSLTSSSRRSTCSCHRSSRQSEAEPRPRDGAVVTKHRRGGMRIVRGALALMMVLGAAPALADDLMKKAQENFKPIPSIVPAVKNNAVTHEKVELGKMLFFDPRLSASETISCNTCHNLATGGVDAGPTSVG